MRTVLVIVTILLMFVTSNVLAIPNCSQITNSWCDAFCEPGWGYIQWTNCDPVQKQYRCKCYSSGDSSPWALCWCPGYEHIGCDCLLEGTQITLADGSTKPIEKIQKGEQVLGYDEYSSTTGSAEVIKTHAPYTVEYYYIINNNLRVTENHPILSNGKWVTVTELEVGDDITSGNGGNVKIDNLDRIDEKTIVYNIQVSGGTYVAEGIIVHNKEDCEDFQPQP